MCKAVLPIMHNYGSVTDLNFDAQIRDPSIIMTHTYFQSNQDS